MREANRGENRREFDADLALDRLFDALSSRRRRYALYYLHAASADAGTIEEITNYVVRLETRVGETDTTAEAVRIELQHVHVPKLEDAGLIEKDSRSETVRYWPQAPLDELLGHARRVEFDGC